MNISSWPLTFNLTVDEDCSTQHIYECYPLVLTCRYQNQWDLIVGKIVEITTYQQVRKSVVNKVCKIGL